MKFWAGYLWGCATTMVLVIVVGWWSVRNEL